MLGIRWGVGVGGGGGVPFLPIIIRLLWLGGRCLHGLCVQIAVGVPLVAVPPEVPRVDVSLLADA